MGNRKGEQYDLFLLFHFLDKCITLVHSLCAIFSSPCATTTKSIAESMAANVFEDLLGWWREGPGRVHLLGRGLTV